MTIDLNVVLGVMMTVLLGLSTWTLVTVHRLSNGAAASAEKEAAQDRRLDEDRARIMDVEEKVTDLQLDLVQIGGKKR